MLPVAEGSLQFGISRLHNYKLPPFLRVFCKRSILKLSKLKELLGNAFADSGIFRLPVRIEYTSSLMSIYFGTWPLFLLFLLFRAFCKP